jgi:hypothetical protein
MLVGVEGVTSAIDLSEGPIEIAALEISSKAVKVTGIVVVSPADTVALTSVGLQAIPGAASAGGVNMSSKGRKAAPAQFKRALQSLRRVGSLFITVKLTFWRE